MTPCIPVDPYAPSVSEIARAAEVLRRGGLVAFPTETVYGLGANATDDAAVARIFVAKGRPSSNPVIVHVAGPELAQQCADGWPVEAERLAAAFWPGPLTLVLRKSRRIPDIVSAGGTTVGIRMPAHPIALALLSKCNFPIAAPSANRSTRISPTTAAHVLRDLDGKIDLILDGGPTDVGLESTVLDLTTNPPQILRRGMIRREQIEAIVGPLATAPDAPSTVARAPGQMRKHYAPRVPLEQAPDSGAARVRELVRSEPLVGHLCFQGEQTMPDDHRCITQSLSRDPAVFAAGLYAALHHLDQSGVSRIVVTALPRDDAWAAIQDRISRAAASGDQ